MTARVYSRQSICVICGQAAAEHSPHSTPYVPLCVMCKGYLCVCVHLYVRALTLRCFLAARWLGEEPRRAGHGSLPRSHTHVPYPPPPTPPHTHTHSAPSLSPCPAANRKGSRLFLVDGARHSRARGPEWAVGGFVAFCFLYFFLLGFCFVFPPSFRLAVCRVHPPFSKTGSRRTYRNPRPRGWGRLSPESRVPRGEHRFAELQPRRALPTERPGCPTLRVGSGPGSSRGGARGGDLSPPRSRCLPSHGAEVR